MSLKYVLAAALAGATLTSPAWALDLNLGLNVQAGAGLGADLDGDDDGADLDLGAVAALDTTVGGATTTDFGAATAGTNGTFRVDAQLAAVIDLIGNTTVTTDAVLGATGVAAIYDITALLNADGALALDAALNANADAVANLQLALAANASLAAALGAAGVSVDDVIALGADANGALVVFVN